MSPPGDIHGSVEANIAGLLLTFGQYRKHGKVRTGEVGIVLRRNPDRIVGADVVFIANRSFPIRRSREGYLETIPDIVVEVLSPNDTPAYINRKLSDYLTAGVPQVWIADPARRELTIHKPDQPPKVFTENETLKLDDPIPGFELRLADVFAD